MEKINSLNILDITISGFKGFCEQQKFMFDSGMNIIVGDNGKGKTTIADAISFAFVGTTFFGEKDLDRLQNLDAKQIYVEIKFTDDIGEIHNIIRTRKDGNMNISYDGINVRQTDLNSIFADKDLFLSMFNPIYFIETLGTGGQELLEKLLPTVKHEDVLSELSSEIQENLKDEKLMSPYTYIKNKRTEIKELEKDLLYLQGQADLLDKEKKKASEAVAKINKKMKETDIHINEIKQSANSEGTENIGTNIETLRLEYNKAQSKYSEQNENEILSSINDEKIILAGLEGENLNFSHADEIIRLEENLKAQYEKYNELSCLIKNLNQEQKCPLCLQEITDGNISVYKNELDKKLKQCVCHGKEIRQNLEKLKNLKDIETKKFQLDKDMKINISRNKIKELESKYETIKNEKSALLEMQKEINELKEKISGSSFSQEQLENINILDQQKTEFKTKFDMLNKILNKKGFEEIIDVYKKELNKFKLLVSDVLFYMGKKNEIIFKNLNMNKVKVILYEVIKSTGEIKDVFKFSYDGKEYKKLSLSEKVKAGLEITELIKKLSKNNYPTFIDNGESISYITNVSPKSQILFSVVTRGREIGGIR